MQLDAFIDAVTSDVESLSALGDEASAAAGERLARAIGPALRLRLLDLMGEAAQEVSAGLSSGHVEVRLAGTDPTFVVIDATEPPEPAPAASEDLSARLTLRLPEALKSAIERSADRDGLSVNSWVVRALKRGLDQPVQPSRPGKRLWGFTQS